MHVMYSIDKEILKDLLKEPFAGYLATNDLDGLVAEMKNPDHHEDDSLHMSNLGYMKRLHDIGIEIPNLEALDDFMGWTKSNKKFYAYSIGRKQRSAEFADILQFRRIEADHPEWPEVYDDEAFITDKKLSKEQLMKLIPRFSKFACYDVTWPYAVYKVCDIDGVGFYANLR